MDRIAILVPLAAGAVALGGVVAWWLRGRLHGVAVRRRFARGRAGEAAAARFLARRGYRILDERLTRDAGLWVDGCWCPVTVRADYLVARGGRTYVVEVKTGQVAPDPTSTATRRQLFEYHHVYRADGLLLLDMEASRLREIRFAPPALRLGRLAWLLAVAAVAVAVGLLAAGG